MLPWKAPIENGRRIRLLRRMIALYTRKIDAEEVSLSKAGSLYIPSTTSRKIRAAAEELVKAMMTKDRRKEVMNGRGKK
jgi:hypothetical protein